MKAELKEVIENTDSEKDKLKHKLKEMTILLDKEKGKTEKLYDVRFL